MSEYVPVKQIVHSEDEPSLIKNVPGKQDVHADAPVVFEYVPAPQDVHSDDAPTLPENVPGKQDVHSDTQVSLIEVVAGKQELLAHCRRSSQYGSACQHEH